MAIGVSFLPGQQGQNATGPTDPQDAVSQAIKILSLRLPRVVGAQAISSPALLNAPGASAVSGSGMNLDRLVQMILGGVLPTAGAQPRASATSGGGVSPSLAQIFAQPSAPSATMAVPSQAPWTPRVIPATEASPAPPVMSVGAEPPVPTRPSQPQQGGGAGLDMLFGSRARRA